MTSTRIGVLLAGFGGLGSQDHQSAMYLPAFLRHRRFDVIGAVDVPGGDGAEKAAREYGLPHLSDLDAGLADPSVAVVSVAAPLEQRAEIVARAVRAGKHVLADKPLAATLSDAEQIERLAAEHGVAVVPAHHQRLHGILRSAQAAVRSGRVGLPWNVQADFLVAGGDPAPTGELVNLALYPIDVVHGMLGLEVRRVYARSGQYWHGGSGDFVALLLDHDHGVTSTIACGRTDPVQDIRPAALAVHRYRISGSHGVLLSDATKPALSVRSTNRHDVAWTGPDTVDALLDVLATAVSTGAAELSAADAVHVQRVVEAAQQSLDSGRPVELDPTPGSNH